MTDMSDTFKNRLRAGIPRQMVHTTGPCVGVIHEESPYCMSGGCKEAREGIDYPTVESYTGPLTDEEGDE